MSEFVHLHNHSEYSVLDGMCRISELVGKAKEFGMPAVALTDHGNMFGAIYFYKEAKKQGIKPIIGCEIYMTDDMSVKTRETVTNHLILLAKNYTGYKNLLKIVSIGHTEGFYFKPRVDKNVLRKYSEGLIASSACVEGELPYYLLRNDRERAKKALFEYLDIFGKDNFYIELMNHGLEKELAVIDKLYELAQENDVKVIATNDAHYIYREDAIYHDALLCINTGKKLNDENRMKMEMEELYFKSTDEMIDLFGKYKGAIENTLEIAEKCNLGLTLDDPSKALFPEIEIPENYSSIDEYFEDISRKGLDNLFEGNVPKEYEERLEYELKMIKDMKFPGFFILLKDLIDEAKKRGIPVGPGRGSAAGSLLLYSLGITDVDPLKYNLFFERFINPERVTMPDVDIDFSDDRRDELYDYARERFGETKVSRIITFVSMNAKGILRDVGRVMEIPLSEVNKIIAEFDKDTAGDPKPSLKNAKKYSSFYKLINSKNTYKTMLQYATRMEGIIKSSGLHAAGMVISPKDVTEFAPLFRDKNEIISTQYDMKSIESVGLLKFDLLGLRTLSTLQYAEDMIKEKDPSFKVKNIDLEDKSTYEMIGRGDTAGVFQLESRGMREFLKRFKPQKFTDLILAIAFYRPGPMQYMDTLINRREGKEMIEYLHPAMEKILKETYGIMVYQEQVMQVAAEIAGFSLGQADNLRRAMGKKKMDIMEKMKKEFLIGAGKKGINSKLAEEIFNDIMKFAQYGFNKSHATAYAILSMQTAYLKNHYPGIFMTAQLNSVIHKIDKITVYLEEAKSMDIKIDYPDINEGGAYFKWRDDKIIVAMGGIKNVGINLGEIIEKERETNGQYKDFFDFIERMYKIGKLNSRAVTFMIQAGVFDSFHSNRQSLIDSYDDIIKYVEDKHKIESAASMSLFGSADASVKKPAIRESEWNNEIRWQMERESLGFFVKDTPMDRYKREWELFSTYSVSELKDFVDEKSVRIVCMIKKKTIKKKRKNILIVSAMDFTGDFELISYDKDAEENFNKLKEDGIYCIEGKTRSRESEESAITIVINKIIPIKKVWAEYIKGIKIFVEENILKEEKKIDSLDKILQKYNKGNGDVYFVIKGEKREYPLMKSNSLNIKINMKTLKDLEKNFAFELMYK